MIKSKIFLCIVIGAAIVQASCSNQSDSGNNETGNQSVAEVALEPFAPNNGVYPAVSDYKDPYFEANYDYLTSVPVRNYPWEKITGGKPINKQNASAYMEAVRHYIADDMRLMIDAPKKWLVSENKKRWYNMGWSAQSYDTTGWEGLEALYGTMTGQVIKSDIFVDYGFSAPMQNHALVYYNDVASVTLNELWKSNDVSGFHPKYTTEAAQFKQNAIVIKAAGTTASANDWSVLEGAGTFSIYRETSFGPEKGKGPIIQELTWIQFDIIIKDTVAAPETGWVFATYIYDAKSPGLTTFDRLTLLGVSWGNDPEKSDPSNILDETYINPDAPQYASATIGYGSRLSGPIDVAVVGGTNYDGSVDSVFVLNENNGIAGGKKYLHFTASACMSCHGTASWPSQNDFYPSPKQILVYSDTLYNPKSKGWSNYYQNRSGTEIMPTLSGQTKSIMALDYDLFMQFALNNSLLGQHLPNKTANTPAGYKRIQLDIRHESKSK